jgi:CheY-like chemotaxis protein
VPQTLLLADDSVTIQRVIELTFADEDIDVVAVSDGDQAIARLNAMPPDIVLVDVGMPGKSGYEVAEYVKQTPRLAHIPVVLLTGAFEPVDQVKAAAAGCDGVLAKPFEPQLVIGRVKELLGRSARPIASLDAGLPLLPTPAAGSWPADPPRTGEAMTVGGAKLDDYFDQLDAAFTNLSGKSADAKTAASSSAPAEIDWFGLKPAPAATEQPDLSLSAVTPLQAFAPPVVPAAPVVPPSAPEPVPVVAPVSTVKATAAATAVAVDVPETARVAEAVEPPSPGPSSQALPDAPPRPPRPLPGLADAFAAILAAEQGEPVPAGPPAWPTTSGAGSTGLAVPDDLVEQVSRRVLEQLSDRVVRDAVAETVSSIAERLVRDEIERIKASIA